MCIRDRVAAGRTACLASGSCAVLVIRGLGAVLGPPVLLGCLGGGGCIRPSGRGHRRRRWGARRLLSPPPGRRDWDRTRNLGRSASASLEKEGALPSVVGFDVQGEAGMKSGR
eukprot:7922980-Alexandrium_andersonii.AAC.1